MQLIGALLLIILATNAVVADETIRFARDIRPILSDNCFFCHGPDPEHREANLRLDTADGLEAAISRGALDTSELLRRVNSADPDELMPPPSSQHVLSDTQKERLTSWVRAGAPWQSHWSFEPVRAVRPPVITDPGEARNWIRNPMDAFVLATLAASNMSPSLEADRTTLIRRVYLDLLGLLPTPEEVREFVTNTDPDAYEKLVDRLLANPHFGERWGRHWLDQARYADSDGFAIDGNRVIWPYRDWVIAAINADMPFDQFTIEQIAGDLLENASADQRVATGFHRNTLVNQEGGTDPEQFRNEAVVDRVNTTGAVWLGLTLGCAQCHTHKFDPISQREYYEFFAFFDSDADVNSHAPQMIAAPAHRQEEVANAERQVAATSAALAEYKQQHPEDDSGVVPFEQARKEAEDSLRKLETQFGKTMVMEALPQPRETHVHVRGDFLRHGEKVEPNVPTSLGALPSSNQKPHTRLDLSRWLVSREQPLTPRVTVNRIWMHYFGRGLVDTENDFGTQGTPPTHPELLDWLAAELPRNDWSLKVIHRIIVTSATYRQSSHARPDLAAIDADNRLLARQNRLRVTAEIIRDLALCSSGQLNDRIGGPSVYPPQPEGVYAFTQNKKNWRTSPGADRYRRGMYTFFYRSAPHPFLTTFDTPNFQTTCTRRLRSNTPLQSLTMANDQVIIEAAQSFADRVLRSSQLLESQLLDTQRIDAAYRICLSRPCRSNESDELLAYLRQQRQVFAADVKSARQLLNANDSEGDATVVERAAWTAVCRVLLNLDEFLTRN